MIADDLFAGAGGWDLAAAELGIHARGVENMKEARATRDAAGLATIHDDVWTFQPDGKATGLIASPPCQTFSAAGKGAGRKALDDVLAGIREGFCNDLDALRFFAMTVGDDRTGLVLTPLHFALAGGYEWLAWEQVPTVLPAWEACAEVLRGKGWNVWTGKLRSEQYGVPQTRTRAFLLASRNPIAPPTPTHSRYYSSAPHKLDAGVRKWVSMAEALGWGLAQRPSPTVTGGGTETGGAEPIAKWARYAKLAASTQMNAAIRSVDEPAHTMAFGHDAASVVFLPADADDVRAAKASGAARRITVAEAGILQSFPADYPWQGGLGKQYLQVGNAVPPGMARPALAAAAGIERDEVAA